MTGTTTPPGAVLVAVWHDGILCGTVPDWLVVEGGGGEQQRPRHHWQAAAADGSATAAVHLTVATHGSAATVADWVHLAAHHWRYAPQDGALLAADATMTCELEVALGVGPTNEWHVATLTAFSSERVLAALTLARQLDDAVGCELLTRVAAVHVLRWDLSEVCAQLDLPPVADSAATDDDGWTSPTFRYWSQLVHDLPTA
jgi:hypothetical protein